MCAAIHASAFILGINTVHCVYYFTFEFICIHRYILYYMLYTVYINTHIHVVYIYVYIVYLYAYSIIYIDRYRYIFVLSSTKMESKESVVLCERFLSVNNSHCPCYLEP